MRFLRATFARIAGLFRIPAADREAADELASHIELHIDDNIRAGMTPDEARRRALLMLGGRDQTIERHRAQRGLPLLETLAQDARYAVRALRKNPIFALTALVTLALGIGANAAMFSFADATAFRPPDVPRPAELLRLFTSTKDAPYDRVSYPDLLDYRTHSGTLAALAAYDNGAFAFAISPSDVSQLTGAWIVTANIFQVLDVSPVLGRGFRDDDAGIGRPTVVVISNRLWVHAFDSDPSVIGRQISLNRQPATIVGVMPAGFAGTELFFHPDIYVPIEAAITIDSSMPRALMTDRSRRWLNVFARPARGAGLTRINAEIATLAHSLEAGYVDTNRGRSALLLPEVTARGRLDGSDYGFTVASMGLVGMVLLLVCANVANLTLSRAASRTREIAVRLAIGASRGRIVRQLLVESTVLAALGCGLGVVLAYGGIGYLSALFTAGFSISDLPVSMEPRIDARVLLFTIAIAAGSAIIVGLSPAWQATRIELTPALKAAQRGTPARHRWLSLRHVLVASQIALAVVLLSVATLSTRALVERQQRSPGFKVDHVLLMTFDPGVVGYSPDQATRFYQQLVARVKTMTGVRAAGLLRSIPLAVNGMPTRGVFVDGYEMPPGQDRLMLPVNVVDSGSWQVLRTRIVEGRAFDERDTATSRRVAIVNETMARLYWPNRNPIGQIVRVPDRTGAALEVIGVAEDGKYLWLTEPQRPFLALPVAQQEPSSGRMTLAVLADGDPTQLATPVRTEAQSLAAGVLVYDVSTLDALFQRRALLSSRLMSNTMSALGSLGWVLAIVGLYGVVAYLTSVRTREIGIRVAIGASRPQVLSMVLRQAMPMIAMGIAAGIALTAVTLPTIATIFDLRRWDAAVMTLVPLTLLASAMAASFIPARRATRVNPVVALRDE